METLCEIAKRDERIWLLTGDLGYSLLEQFREMFPERFVNVGVAEQAMAGIAAGMAFNGKIVYIYSIANFPIMRCLEQIRNDICYHNLNVKIVAVGGGLAYGALSYSHHAIEDLSIMRSMPNMTVIAPADPTECKWATTAMSELNGPAYLRLNKTGEPILHDKDTKFKIGQAVQMKNGADITLISTGNMLEETIKVSEILQEDKISVRLLSMHTLKPIDKKAILSSAKETKLVVTVEEHSVIGGLLWNKYILFYR